MMIPFKCPHCKKPLRVKKELAGKRAACPACKKPIVIPAPVAAPADLEAFAAAALTEEQAAKEEVVAKPIKFTCNWCDEEVEVAADLAGKQTPCPACKRIVKVPLPKKDKPKDWRELAKQGPAAALINQPEQLDGAWGTEFKGRVSRTALEEAEALPDVEIAPIGIRGWLRRGAIAAAVLGVVSLLFFVASRQRTARRQKDAVREALSFVEAKKDDKEWKDRLPVLKSVIHNIDGQLKLRDEKPLGEPLDAFKKARAQFLPMNYKEPNLDYDLFLLDLALAQIGLAGTEDQVLAQTRLKWGDLRAEIDQTLRCIKMPEAKPVTARELAGALLFFDQPQLAVNLPSVMNLGDAQAVPQQNALIFALGDEKAALAAIGETDPKKNPKMKDMPLAKRLAMAEGHAWKGELAEARKYVEEPGADYHKYYAAVGVASVLLANKKNPDGAKQAAPFVADAIKWSKGVPNKWPVLQLVRVAARADQAGQVQEHVKNLEPPYKRRAQLDLFIAQLEKAGADVNVDQLITQLPDKEGPNRALAWLALNRHLAHHGLAARMPDAEDADYEVFAKLGLALGGQDRRAE